MPVTSGTYANNETQIYSFLTKTVGFSSAAACGVLANIEVESGFNHDQNSGKGTWDVNGYSYGICQWHDIEGKGGRFTALKNYCSKYGYSYRTLAGQLAYLLYELNSDSYLKTNVYDVLVKTSNNSQGSYNAAYTWCTKFERPANADSQGKTRGNKAKDTYYPYYSKNGSSDSSKSASNLGQKIVQIARSTVGLAYIWGGEMYDTNMKGADCSGLVYYCYKEAGIDIGRGTADSIYQKYKNTAKKINSNSTAAADLLFYENNSSSAGLDHIAIANGAGGMIHAANSSRGIVEDSSIGSPTYILRILSDGQTSQGEVPSGGTSIGGGSTGYIPVEGIEATEYTELTSYDPYASIMESNLSKVEAAGYDYGYLIDMTNGGEFKFYVPEFSEQAGSNWSDVDIRGRSITVKSYNSTNSRKISIALDLYAGVGLYTATSGESGEDTISRLHRDMYFVKSLEYPDYSNVITRPPSVVHLILGSAINIAGVVSDVLVEHLKPLDEKNRAMYMKLSFTVTQIAVNPIDYRDVRNCQYTLIDTNDIGSMYTGLGNSNSSIIDNTHHRRISGRVEEVR